MICKACGRVATNENANFCDYCGASFRENASFDAVVQNTSERYSVEEENKEKTISFKNWLGSMMLCYIPIIGIFVYIVMLFIWAFGSDVPQTKKNWARARLVYYVIITVLLVFYIVNFTTQFMNSGLSIEEYMNQYLQGNY